jgi:hypothetical protein
VGNVKRGKKQVRMEVGKRSRRRNKKMKMYKVWEDKV